MKRSLSLIVIGFFALVIGMSCKKAIEKKAQNMLMDVITNGVWIVEQYFEGSNNISGQFLNYTFQFYENGTVKGTLGTNVANGTWEADIDKYTITSEFPGAGDPLVKLNYTWLIKDSYVDYVEAETTTTAGKNILHLRKKP